MKKLIACLGACLTAALLTVPAFADVIAEPPPTEIMPPVTVDSASQVPVLAVALVIVAAALLAAVLLRRRRGRK